MQIIRLAGLTALLFLIGCNSPEASPTPIEIQAFTASPDTIANSGTPVILSWETNITPSSTEIIGSPGGDRVRVTGTEVTVNPEETTFYTLTVRSDDYADQEVATVTVTNPAEPPTPDPPAYEGPDVRYWVRSDCGRVATTYATADGGTAQRDFGNGYVYTAEEVSRGTFLYISAQNQCRSGDVTVRIYEQGEISKETTSSGAYVIATASGTF